MRLFKDFGMESIAWSLRRLHVPVARNALVLEVGSGGNPYARSNVLLDAYENDSERASWDAALIQDRPTVLGVAERLPFKDKSFDFVIACHVLEHTTDPEAFLKEAMRVGKAGYIETPDAFFERLIPYKVHRLEVMDTGGHLVLRKKPSWRPHPELTDLFERRVCDAKFVKFLNRYPERFNMRFYWKETISYEIVNPEVDISWPMPSDDVAPQTSRGFYMRFRSNILKWTRLLFSQNKRNRTIDLYPLLDCTVCQKSQGLVKEVSGALACRICSATYPLQNGKYNLHPPIPQREPVGSI